MEAPEPLKRLGDAVSRFVTLERAIAAVLVTNPAILWLFDSITQGATGVRGSISAYYDMEARPAFFVPLLAAAFMLIFSGVIKPSHWYNWILGTALALVVIFNKDGFSALHYSAALAFYGGYFVVVMLSRAAPLLKLPFLGAGVVTVVLAMALDSPTTLFWAEWAGNVLVAAHYMLHAQPSIAYQAPLGLEELEKPSVARMSRRRRPRKRARSIPTTTRTQKKPATRKSTSTTAKKSRGR